MKNKKEEFENKFLESGKSESYEEIPMQNYNPCMYCPMMMYCPTLYENVNMQARQMMPEYDDEGFEEQEEYRPYPGPGSGHNYGYLINQPVGVSLTNGQGVSGILCSVTNREIYLLVYLYHSQFATKHYSLNQIQDIYKFPKCQSQG